MRGKKILASIKLHCDTYPPMSRMKDAHQRNEVAYHHHSDCFRRGLQGVYGIRKASAFVVLSLLVLVIPVSTQTISGSSQESGAAIRPFTIHIPDSTLADLHRRLVQTKWPDQLPGTSWEYGADIRKVREVADYWEKTFNWREQEARINQFDQFTTEIDGQKIYFIHQRSPRPSAIPLLLIHGWPGSIVEFLELIKPLTQPTDSDMPAFDVVIPSLPGFGFSGPTTTRGWNPDRMAKTFIVLMGRLGYKHYGVQGGDWGAAIALDIAHDARDHVIGVHLNLLPLSPPNPEAYAQMSQIEGERCSYFKREESSHFFIKAAEPQTLSYAFTDSPVGWLASVVELFQQATDNNGDFLAAVKEDAFLTDVTLYWVTDTLGSSMRIYRENRLTGEEATASSQLQTPIAFADFPKELYACPVRWAKPTYNVVQYTRMPRGGHFAAMEQPDLLVKDVRKFFANERANRSAE